MPNILRANTKIFRSHGDCNLKSDTSISKTRLISAVLSVAAGCINGMIGTGGGIVLTYMFSHLENDKEIKDHLVCSMAVMLPVSCVSILTYGFGNFDSAVHFITTAVSAVVGGFIGGVIGERAAPAVLRRIFAAVVIWGGISMIF